MSDNLIPKLSTLMRENDKWLDGIESEKRLEYLSGFDVKTPDGQAIYTLAYWLWVDIDLDAILEAIGLIKMLTRSYLTVKSVSEDTLRCLKCDVGNIVNVYFTRENYLEYDEEYRQQLAKIQENPNKQISQRYMCEQCCIEASEQRKRKKGFIDYLDYLGYLEYLKSDKWEAIRAVAIENAKGRCQLCYSTYHLQVHHRTYERLGHEDLSDLTVLCRKCHAKFHNKSGG